MFSNTQRHMPRASMPRIPSLKTALIAGMTIAGAMSMLPSTGQSAPSHFASPISELMSMRAPVWGAESASYKPLPQRSARQNELLNQAVSILTQGEASQNTGIAHAIGEHGFHALPPFLRPNTAGCVH